VKWPTAQSIVFAEPPAFGVSGLPHSVGAKFATWTTSASAFLLAPAVMYPGALAATAGASVLASRGRLLLSAMLTVVAVIAWSNGHRRGRARARTAAQQHQLSGLHLATIEALASAIDAKDKTSAKHIQQVQAFARALAREVGVPETEVQAITTAALLHDVGKLAVPEHILSKPGPLTDEEFEKIKIHPQVGFEIIEHVPFPCPVAPLVLCHHERWDGLGYPLGLRGDDIPLGARILAVSDYFDSVMRDRPYNKGISAELAMLSMQQQSGKALDPHLVSVFLDLLPTLRFEGPLTHGTGGLYDPSRRHHSPETDGRAAFENIARAHQEIYTLYEIAQAIGSSLGAADTMSLIAEKLITLVPFSSCALFVSDDDGTVRCRYAAGVNEDDLRELVLAEGQGLAGWVIRNRRTLVNGRPAADFEAAELPVPATELKSALVCPLISSERVVGAIALYHVDQKYYSEEHRRLLDRISEQTAAAIANSIVFEQTREDSLRDALTGLPNTRYMFTHLTRELARAQRLGTEVAILVLDLDDFKRINDTYGHQTGDRALQEVSRALRETVRHYDVCARYAGDEFIIVLPGCGAEEAEAKRVELQNAVSDISLEVAPDQPVQVSMSAGAAVFPSDGETYEILLATADGRMYRDKKTRKPAEAVKAAAQPVDRAAAGAFPAPAPALPALTSTTHVN
jgi:diguanylate cyclase (GGDEF)-like protein/putative nucleotidyltransferase with HDIG domain